ncbi:MAG: SufD family Fe-S cluster assembly protein [Elusimicrobia bacterium]|nr:SufD family Fe-S cluster assembly protein [Elusimicrobiota bacterium]
MPYTGGFLDIGKDYQSKYGFSDPEKLIFKSKKGLDREIVEQISSIKNEPDWMRQIRLEALEIFFKKPMPNWGDTELMNAIQFGEIYYYLKSTDKTEKNWEDVPEAIKNTFEKLGIPEAERKFLAGVTSQYDSEAVYHRVREDLEKQGVIFLDMDSGLRQYPDLVKEYFGTVIPSMDNKFAALNTAVWSGGSFIYVPKGVKVELPLQAYFRINAKNAGQFERTLIIADEGSSVHYIEGCLPEGEWVSLGDTFCAIDEVKPGTKALNSLGVEAEVIATRKRPYKGDLVKIVPVSVGNAFELTPEHPVWAIRRPRVSRARKNRSQNRWDVSVNKILDAEPEWVPASQLKVGDILCFPVAAKTQDHLEISDDLLQFLGYYLAEGSAFFNGKTQVPTVTLSFNIKESDKIEESKKLIHVLTGKKAGEFRVPEKHESRVYVYSHELLALSWKYCGRHAALKQLHRDVMELPPQRQKLLFETYLKGDGSRHLRESGHTLVRCSTVSRTLAFQLQEILARNGIYAGMQVRKAFQETMKTGRKIQHREAYCLHFEEGRKVCQAWKDEKRNCFWVPIRAIKKRSYVGMVYNLEMKSAPNAYLARGFAVHNCTAPNYASDSLHSAVVELVARPGAHIRYTTIQNWSNNVFNLVTKRAVAHKDAIVEWLDGNLGSKLTMKFPCVYLVGEGARGEIISCAFAGKGQHQDAGAKLFFCAPHTSGTILSKSISKDGGRASYRGLVKAYPGATNAKVNIRCDALLMDKESRSDTYPTMEIDGRHIQVEHEATVSKIGEEQLFYLMSRGLKESEAVTLVVNGFFEAFTKELPLEYAVELNRLIQMEMEGAVG